MTETSDESGVPEGAQASSPAAAARPEFAGNPDHALGGMLRAARERQGLSVGDVAQRLKFAPRQIEALEAGNRAALPSLTFVRGFVRSYAKLLGMDADALVNMLERGAGAEQGGPSTEQLQNLSATQERFPMPGATPGSAWPWIIATLVAVVGIGGFILYQWQAPDSVARPPKAESAAVAVPLPGAAPAAVVVGAAASAGADLAAPAPASAAAATSGAATAAPATDTAAAGKNGKIHLVFGERSWTEVRQADGQVVFSRENMPGTDAWVDGTAPFDFIIGNAQGVKLYLRGSEVDLKPYTKVSVARMQLK